VVVSSDETQSVTFRETRLIRRFVRARPPAASFVPGGLLPLLGLLLLLIYGVSCFARGSVQGVVRDQVLAAFAGQDLDWATVEVSGQNVVVGGTPPATADGARALLAAERTQCATWLGARNCTIDVAEAFTAPAATAPPTPAPAPVPLPPPVESSEVDSCDQDFADILAGSSLEFETGRAALQPSAGPILAEVAAVAARCPGALRVEGHADDRGADELNLELSQARAEAVVEALAAAGVSRSRMAAQGFGETRPVAANDTADGRARNRRIEIRMATEPEGS
jgi:outer membrane protein OmpA-like peptidoglycan-associated protein